MQSEQGELGDLERVARPQGGDSALQVLSGGVLWGLCVCACVCACVCMRVQEGTGVAREERQTSMESCWDEGQEKGKGKQGLV